MKLVVAEAESVALRAHLRRRRPLVSSALARTEVLRAVLGEGNEALARARSVLSRIDLLRISDRVLNAAGELLPADIRSLDAIHLASAVQLGTDLRSLITCDQRMLDAARHLNLNATNP